METDHFKTPELFALFSVFKDEAGMIYREDFQTFINNLEQNLLKRRVKRPRSSLSVAKPQQNGFNFDEATKFEDKESKAAEYSAQVEFLIDLLKNTINVSSTKIDELMHPDLSSTAKNQVCNILLNLNDDLLDSVSWV